MTKRQDPTLDRLKYIQPKRQIIFIYKKEYSFVLFVVFLSVFVIAMFSYHFSYWEYSEEMHKKDPIGMTMGFYQYTASVWVSLGMFMPPLLAAACLFDYLGIIDAYMSWELYPGSRQGRRMLVSLLRKKYYEGVADLDVWLSSLRKDR